MDVCIYMCMYIIYIFIYGFVYLMDVWYIRIVHLVCRYAHKFKGRQVWYSQRNQCNCHVDRTWPWACRTCPKGWTPAQSHRRWPSRDKILASKKNIYIYSYTGSPNCDRCACSVLVIPVVEDGWGIPRNCWTHYELRVEFWVYWFMENHEHTFRAKGLRSVQSLQRWLWWQAVAGWNWKLHSPKAENIQKDSRQTHSPKKASQMVSRIKTCWFTSQEACVSWLWLGCHSLCPPEENRTSRKCGWSKPWYLMNPKIAGKWMFIPLIMYL